MIAEKVTTVLGEISPEALGFCQMHEHIMLRKGVPALLDPALMADDIEKSTQELSLLRAAGGADNFHAVRAVALGNRAADTTAGPGDDDDFSLYAAKIHDGVLLFLINSFWINNFCCISASLVLYYQ